MSDQPPGTDRTGRNTQRVSPSPRNYENRLQLTGQEAKVATAWQVERPTVMCIPTIAKTSALAASSTATCSYGA